MNERQGLPSASSMERYALCPGSYAAERGLPDTTSADAETGNRIHAALAGEAVTPPLTDDEQRVMEACQSQATWLLDTILPHRDDMRLEQRMWAGKEWSGKPDLIAIDTLRNRAVVIDYKTGRGEVTRAEGNMQLRALAVLVYRELWVESVTVAIVQPLAGEVSVAEYSGDDLVRASLEIDRIIEGIHAERAPRSPSAAACKYCKAKGTCLEAQAMVERLSLEVSRDGREIVMSPERIAAFLDIAPAAEAVIEAVRAKARRMLEAGEQIPGWTLKPGSVRESITDPSTVFGRFMAAGGTQEQFMPCVSVTKTKLKDALKTMTGEKGKALDARLESILAGCTEEKQAAASLVKVKEVA
jgi:CRISPR/Cas system-associated exonuclease Cas4 (RecB family)